MGVDVPHAFFHTRHLFAIVGRAILLPAGIVAIKPALILCRKAPLPTVVSIVAVPVAVMVTMPVAITRIVPVAPVLAMPCPIPIPVPIPVTPALVLVLVLRRSVSRYLQWVLRLRGCGSLSRYC